MIDKVISKRAIINQFNVAVLEHPCETFREKHPDIVDRVYPQRTQNGLSILRLLPLSVRLEVTPPHLQGVDRRDVAGRHLRETSSQIHLQKGSSILSR